MLLPLPAFAHDISAQDFFRADREYWSKGSKLPRGPGKASVFSLDNNAPRGAAQKEVADAVAAEVRKRLGAQHVETALRLTKLESGFRCHVLGPKTRHGRAVGPLQIMPSSARALGISNIASCEAQITAGVLHMKKCLSVGAVTYRDMAACHVSGWGGWNKRLNRKANAYRNQYIRMANASSVPAWAGGYR